jgi:hypothetical protein
MKLVLPPPRFTAPLIGWLVGMIAVFHKTLVSGLRWTPGGQGDARHMNYILEHGWRWLVGDPSHAEFWSPPVLWPFENVAAFTDLLFGFGPMYWPWRVVGIEPRLAFVLFVLASWSLNYLAGHLLLRRCFALSPPAAAAGAFIFAFSAPRAANIAHPQLIPQVLIVIALVAVIRLLEGTERPWRWSAALGASLVAQFYAAVYPFFFFGLGLVLTAIAANLVPGARTTLWSTVRRAWLPLTVSAVVSAAILAPGVGRYMAVKAEREVRPYRADKQTTVHSLWLPGARSLLYSWMYDRVPTPHRGAPHANGIGPVTTVIALIGLWLGRRRPRVVWLTLGVAVLVGVTLSWHGSPSVWSVVLRDLVPGAASIRSVARVGRFLLFPAALGVGLSCSWLLQRRRWAAAVVLAGICVVEQLHRPFAYDRVEVASRESTIAAAIPVDCGAFYLTIAAGLIAKINEDAVWASLISRTPTVNAPFAHLPPSYPLARPVSRSREDRERRSAELDRWIASEGLDPDAVCWLGWNPRTQRATLWRTPIAASRNE